MGLAPSRTRRMNAHLDMQKMSTVMNLPDAAEDGDATPLRQVREMVSASNPETTDFLALYLLAKS